MICYGSVLCNMAWYGYDIVWYSMVCYGIVWCSMVWYGYGMILTGNVMVW